MEELVWAKAEGQEVEPAAAPPEATNVVDLMAALQSSIDQASQGAGGAGPARRKRGTVAEGGYRQAGRG